jgi:hypothetical protein
VPTPAAVLKRRLCAFEARAAELRKQITVLQKEAARVDAEIVRCVSAGRSGTRSNRKCAVASARHGQSRYASRYRDAVESIGLDYQTIRNYA